MLKIYYLPLGMNLYDHNRKRGLDSSPIALCLETFEKYAEYVFIFCSHKTIESTAKDSSHAQWPLRVDSILTRHDTRCRGIMYVQKLSVVDVSFRLSVVVVMRARTLRTNCLCCVH